MKQDTSGLDELDNAYIALRDALDAKDTSGVRAALQRLSALALPADEDEVTTKLLGAASSRSGR